MDVSNKLEMLDKLTEVLKEKLASGTKKLTLADALSEVRKLDMDEPAVLVATARLESAGIAKRHHLDHNVAPPRLLSPEEVRLAMIKRLEKPRTDVSAWMSNVEVFWSPADHDPSLETK